MALHKPTSARPHRTRTPQAALLAGYPRRRLLRPKERLCPWRLLPKDFPPWKTVYDWFRRWRIDGTWERLNTELRDRLRCRLGRDPHPSAGIVDSHSQPGPREWEAQSAASTPPRSWKAQSAICSSTPKVWCSKPKYTAPGAQSQSTQRQSSGRRWHQAALLESARDLLTRLWHLWVDAGCQGRGRRWAEEVLGVSVEVVRKPKKPLPEEVAEVWARE